MYHHTAYKLKNTSDKTPSFCFGGLLDFIYAGKKFVTDRYLPVVQ